MRELILAAVWGALALLSSIANAMDTNRALSYPFTNDLYQSQVFIEQAETDVTVLSRFTSRISKGLEKKCDDPKAKVEIEITDFDLRFISNDPRITQLLKDIKSLSSSRSYRTDKTVFKFKKRSDLEEALLAAATTQIDRSIDGTVQSQYYWLSVESGYEWKADKSMANEVWVTYQLTTSLYNDAYQLAEVMKSLKSACEKVSSTTQLAEILLNRADAGASWLKPIFTDMKRRIEFDQ